MSNAEVNEIFHQEEIGEAVGAERAAIVAYLRKQGARPDVVAVMLDRRLIDDIADEIEQGCHHE